MQLMVVVGKTEKDRFKKAIHERIARSHEPVRGRAAWLYRELLAYKRTHRQFQSVTLTEQICGYWLRGQKLPTGLRLQLLCAALDMTRGQLFGESYDPRLAKIIRKWSSLPEHVKNGMGEMAGPDDTDKEQDTEIAAEPDAATQ